MIPRREINIRPRPQVAQIPHRQADVQPHFASHDDERHIPPQQRHDKQQRPARLLYLPRRLVLPLRDLPVRGRQHPGGGRHQQEDGREDGVDLGGEDEEGEEGEAPDYKIQGDGGVELRGAVARGVGGRGVRGAEL